jgi:hypothetical protein
MPAAPAQSVAVSRLGRPLLALLAALGAAACAQGPVARAPDPAARVAAAAPATAASPGSLDVLITGGTVYDGTGGPALQADVGICGDRIAAVGAIDGTAPTIIDARGLAGAPGFPGLLKAGMFADVVVFDPATVADRATYEQPHQYAVGVQHVLVNGVPVLRDGEHTGATPGRALWGRGTAGGRS